MPPLLRRSAIRLFEASQECLDLAISSLGATKRRHFREPEAAYAPEIGLIGAAAELGMSACLVQAFDLSFNIQPDGKFKLFPMILEDFRALVNSSTPASDFLVQGISDPDLHRTQLWKLTLPFSILATARAKALHGGSGLCHEVSVIQANRVADFLSHLGESSRIHPYLAQVPRSLLYDEERVVIVEDLARRIAEASQNDLPALLLSAFLVLPDVPVNEPDWLAALERVTVAPRKQDIRYLVSVLENALPATLVRASKTGGSIPVVVRPGDPKAIPIETHNLKRQLNNILDQWNANIGIANGRRANGFLDLPSGDFVRDIFSFGLENAGILEQGKNLGPHESWPFIAASLNMQGTPGPYWFLVRRTDDLRQLRAILRDVSALANRSLQSRLDMFETGLNAIISNKALPPDSHWAKLCSAQDAMKQRLSLMGRFDRYKDSTRALDASYIPKIREISDENSPVGELIMHLLDSDISFDALKYWVRMLCESALDLEDARALTKVLQCSDLQTVHTLAKKAIQRIDCRLFGPVCE